MSVFFLLAIFSGVINVLASEYETPIIGVVAQQLSPSLQKAYPAYSAFIAAAYVKAIESAGARVVPISINKNESYYR